VKHAIHDVVIVGGGISGLALLTFLRDIAPRIDAVLLEAGPRAGGAIVSASLDSGYLGEAGPHGFLDNCDESRHLMDLVGLTDRAIKAPLGRYSRYICLGGRLRRIPQSPAAVAATRLVSPGEKLRILTEWRRPPLEGEPTVGQWVAHRFGEALLPFSDAVITGTHPL